MTLSIDTTKVANDVAEKADEILDGVDHTPFSVAAFDVLKGKVGQYVGDVVRESAAIAKHQQVDIISAKHVESACERLTFSPQQRLYRHLGTVAGLCLGASASALSSMLIASQFTFPGIVFTVCTGIPGAFLLGIHMTRD